MATEPKELAGGIYRIDLPLPLIGLDWVNSYVIEGSEGVTVIDVGVDNEEGVEALGSGLAAIGYGLDSITQVVATHLHPDHVGLAGHLVDEVGCRWVMESSALDNLYLYNDWGKFRDFIGETALANGGPAEHVALLTADEPRPGWAPVSIPPTDSVADGDKISLGEDRWLEVVHTPGHEPSHLCLVDSATGAMFSGDHVLPRITPFVPHLGEGTDNLGTYLASLKRVEAIDPPVTYPAHGVTIERGKERAHQIRLHHQRRLEGIVDIVKDGATAWEVMLGLFRPHLPPMHQRLAFGETMSHVEHLRSRGVIDRTDESGTYIYRKAR